MKFLTTLVALMVLLIAGNARAQFGDPFGDPFGSAEAEPEVAVEVIGSIGTITAGEQFAIAVVFDMQPGWHINTNNPTVPPELSDWTPIPTLIEIETGEGITAGPIQWPSIYTVEVNYTGSPAQLEVYEGRAIAYIPMLASADLTPGEVSAMIRISFQACDDTVCLVPTDLEETIAFQAVTGEARAAITETAGEDFAGFDPSVYARVDQWNDEIAAANAEAAASTTDGDRSFFGIPLPSPTSPAGIAVFVLLAALGGLILNLTPCVLPVIPIKVLSITQHAGTPRQALMLGFWMAAGVVAFWAGIGVVAATVVGWADPSRLFGIWWVTLGIGVLIAAMGVGIMGLFAINLPKAVYAVNPRANSPHGSFLFGVMTAVLGLPCFGFVAGALLAGSATMPTITILAIFFGIGAGMALPYLILSANPKLLEAVPRTGPASELVKQIMGLLLLAAAAYFVGAGVLALLSDQGVYPAWWGKIIHWWVIALFVAAAGVWLLWQTVKITPKAGRRLTFGVIALVMSALGVAAAASATTSARNNFWIPWTAETEADALAEGKTVVMDFTAEWCLNCKALKATVLNVNPVKSELLAGDVVPLTVDLTSDQSPGWARLRELGQTGIPTLVVQGPGSGGSPWVANAYTPDQVMRAVGDARSSSLADSR